jgi:hypothetical protein
MDDLPRPATWISDSPPRSQVGRGLAAIAAIVIGIAALAAAGVILVRQITDARAQGPAATFAPPITEVATTTGPPEPTLVEVDPSSVVTLEDETGRLVASVPVDWQDVATSAWISGGREIGVRINAAPDRAAWFEGWGTPGVFIGVTEDGAPDARFDDFSSVCTHQGRQRAMAGVLAGEFDLWTDCGLEGGTLAVVVAEPEDRSFVMLIQVIVVDGDWHGYSAIMESVAYRR